MCLVIITIKISIIILCKIILKVTTYAIFDFIIKVIDIIHDLKQDIFDKKAFINKFD